MTESLMRIKYDKLDPDRKNMIFREVERLSSEKLA